MAELDKIIADFLENRGVVKYEIELDAAIPLEEKQIIIIIYICIIILLLSCNHHENNE